MTTLLLGHGKKVSLYCRPKIVTIPETYLTVDIDPINEPDVIADLRKDPLPFEDNSIDKIIDTGGLASIIWCRTTHFWKEMYRILKPNGKFYGITRHYIEINFLPNGFDEILCELPENFDGKIMSLPRSCCFILMKNKLFSNEKRSITQQRVNYNKKTTFEMRVFTIKIKQLQCTRKINVKKNWYNFISYDIDITQKNSINTPKARGGAKRTGIEYYWDIIVTSTNFLKLKNLNKCIDKIELEETKQLFEYNKKSQNWQINNIILKTTDFVIFHIFLKLQENKEILKEI